ncbi:MAG TPA: DcaP family trimeric outer membrane transporter [Steroidobacteraceae bacterium]|jgi:hypothetical protein
MLPVTLDLYGFIEVDVGYERGQSNPDWFDVARPSKLPTTPDEFGRDGRTFASVRPSRVGAKLNMPSAAGDIRATLEADAFGSDNNVGQTAFRLRLASIESERFGAGLTWSPFTDGGIFPASLEFFGPPGITKLRNILVYWRPLNDGNRFTIALERPGATGDGGIYADRIDLQDVHLRFPLPDLTTAYRWTLPHGHLQLAAVARTIQIDDDSAATATPETRIHGWGASLSGSIEADPDDQLKWEAVYGAGVENYVNDAPVDVAARTRTTNSGTSATAAALPVLGLTAFLEHSWSPRWSSIAGYSLERITNSNAQTPQAFHRGEYALLSLVRSPAPGLKYGAELQWVRRASADNGFAVSDLRLQFTVRLNFEGSFTLTK